MPYNGSGLYSRTFNWQTDKRDSIPVTASRMDDEHDGFATGLSTAICRDGQSTCTARIPFALGVDMYAGGPTNATLGLRFISDPDCGIYRSAANTWHLVAGGLDALTVGPDRVTSNLPLYTTSFAITGTGGTTFSGPLNVNGDFKVQTSAFTVDSATGNTTMAGTLSMGGTAFTHTATTPGTVSAGVALPTAGATFKTTHVKTPGTGGLNGVGLANDATFTWDFWGEDAAGTSRNLARFDVLVEEPSAVGMDAMMRWRVISNGAVSTFGIIMSGEQSTFRPVNNNTIDLGNLTATWRNLYLGGAATISFGTPIDMDITHSSNKLTFNGGVVDFNDGITVNSTSFSVTPSQGTIYTAGEVRVDGDNGGQASCNTLTGASFTTLGAGTGTVKMTGGTSRNSAGFIKFYIGTTAYYAPVWNDIT